MNRRKFINGAVCGVVALAVPKLAREPQCGRITVTGTITTYFDMGFRDMGYHAVIGRDGAITYLDHAAIKLI